MGRLCVYFSLVSDFISDFAIIRTYMLNITFKTVCLYYMGVCVCVCFGKIKTRRCVDDSNADWRWHAKGIRKQKQKVQYPLSLSTQMLITTLVWARCMRCCFANKTWHWHYMWSFSLSLSHLNYRPKLCLIIIIVTMANITMAMRICWTDRSEEGQKK